jgi:hypothetical protein
MYRYNYTNPLTKQYQAEYAMYKAAAGLFAGVSCRSLTLDRLKLYYAELSDKAKEDLEKEVRFLLDRDVTGKVCFPAMEICRAEIKIRNKADGTHSFTFTDGVYSFSLSILIPRRGGKKRLKVTGRKISGLKPSKKSNTAAANAQLCA